MDYFSHMRQRLDGKEPFVPGFLGNKDRVRQIADILGINTPNVYYTDTISELLSKDLPDEFVLKPTFASTSLGVRLLKKTETGFRDLVRDSELSTDDILNGANEINKRYFKDGDEGVFVIEEILRDRNGHSPPDDIRAYTFQGQIGMILTEQHLTSPAKAMYFDGDFLPFADVQNRYGVAKGQDRLEEIVQAKVPENWKQLLNVARRVSSAMPTAFCRVDMYDTPGGVILGEITFYPGTFITHTRKIMHHSEAERLGRIWDAAFERLEGSLEIKYGSQIRTVP